MGTYVIFQFASVVIFNLAIIALVLFVRKTSKDVEEVKKSLRNLEEQMMMAIPRAAAARQPER